MSEASVTKPDFYRVVAQHRKQMKEVHITVTSMEDALSLIDACDEVFVQAKGSLNEEIKEIEEEIHVLSNDPVRDYVSEQFVIL
jgi:hypothetical protein